MIISKAAINSSRHRMSSILENERRQSQSESFFCQSKDEEKRTKLSGSVRKHSMLPKGNTTLK